MQLANTALALAELGYRVFPCIKGTKTPATQHGCLDATSDEEQITKWWSMWPEANVAVSTDGLIIVDLDPKPDGQPNDWMQDAQRLDSLQRGAVAITPRNGRHCWFRQPAGANWSSRVSALAPQVDTRANGGYVVVPPSSTPDGPYTWLPAWELTIPADKLPLPPQWLIDLLSSVENHRRPPVRTIGERIESGARNDSLFRFACHARRGGHSEAEILSLLLTVNEARCDPRLDEKEVCKIAASAARYEPDQITVSMLEDWAGADLQRATELTRNPGDLPESFCAVPGILGDVIRWNLETAHRPQPQLALAAALALMGTLTGRRITDRLGTRTNIYTLGVAATGQGKEHARKVNKAILHLANMEKRIGPEDFGSHAGLICAVSDEPEILFQLDEMGRFLRTTAGSNAPAHLQNVITVLLKMFTSSNSLFVGPAYAETAKIKRIDQPHACLYGTTVPDSLFEALTTESLSDGFIGRLLVFEAPGWERGSREEQLDAIEPSSPPESIISEAVWWRGYVPGSLLSVGIPRPRVLSDSSGAKDVFRDFQTEIGSLGGANDTRRALWVRAYEKARKLALLYSASENREGMEISADAAMWACQVVRHLTARMEHLAERWLSDTPFGRQSQKIYRMIEDVGKDGLTGSELCRKTQGLKPREREDAIHSLVLSGRIAHIRKDADNTHKKKNVYVAARWASES